MKLDDLIELLEESKEAQLLLEDIWLELGPYTNHISQGIVRRLQHHFNFDDSE